MGRGREVVLLHPPCYRSHGTDLFDILVLLCTCLIKWNANLICKPLGLFEGNHLLFGVIILIPHCIAGQGVGPVHASGGGASACIRGWDQCMHQGVGPVDASGGRTSAWSKHRVVSCIHAMVHCSPVQVLVCMQTEYRWLGRPGYAGVSEMYRLRWRDWWSQLGQLRRRANHVLNGLWSRPLT